MMNRLKATFLGKNKNRTICMSAVIIAYFIVEALMISGSLKSLFINLLVPVTSYIVVALALNLVVGISGELSLGHAGFMSIGAFTGVIVAGITETMITNDIVRLIIAIIIGAIVAAVFGFLISIPVLKLEGDYLAIVTLAFGQIIKSLINNTFLGYDASGFHFSFITNKIVLDDSGMMLINGPIGATGTNRISTFTVGVILILITVFIIFNFINSKYGRNVMATRDDRIAAQSVGINIVKTKMIAFVLSAGIAGAAGVLYGLNFSTLVPAKFDFNQSILILVYVVLGGLGNMMGTIISTTILVLLPEVLRFLSDYRMLIYAIVLIVIMIVTNNPTITSFLKKIFSNKKNKGAQNDG